MKNISSHKYVDLCCSLLNKIILNATSPYFQKVGGVIQPLIFHQGQNILSRYHVNPFKMNLFLLSRHFNFFNC